MGNKKRGRALARQWVKKWRRNHDRYAANPDPREDISEDRQLDILMEALRQRLFCIIVDDSDWELPLHYILLRPLRDEEIAEFSTPLDLWIRVEHTASPPLKPEQLQGLARRMVEACLELGIVCHLCRITRPPDVGQKLTSRFYLDAYPAPVPDEPAS